MEFWFLGFVLGQGFGLFFDTLVGCLPYLLGGSFFVLLHFYPLRKREAGAAFGILFGERQCSQLESRPSLSAFSEKTICLRNDMQSSKL